MNTKILLVDDHHDSLVLTARFLRMWGYEVAEACSCREAVRYADEKIFDLLISDISLSDGTGLELRRKLGEKVRNAIALSGFGLAEDFEASREAGFSHHILKPFDVKHFKALVEQAVA